MTRSSTCRRCRNIVSDSVTAAPHRDKRRHSQHRASYCSKC
jgi:hypothetical protein